MSDEESAAPQMVPLDRLNKAIEARKAAEAKARDAEKRAADLEASAAEATTWREKFETAAKSHADEIARRDSQLAFVRAGVDDEEIQTVLLDRWRGMDSKGRPPLSEWLTEGAREDKIAARFFEAPAPAETPAEAPAAQPTPAPVARTNAGAAPTPPASREMDRATYYQRMSQARTAEEKRAVMAEYMRGN